MTMQSDNRSTSRGKVPKINFIEKNKKLAYKPKPAKDFVPVKKEKSLSTRQA